MNGRAWLLAVGLALAPAWSEPQVGEIAPPVRLSDQRGDIRDVALEYGRAYVALAFYPRDDTPGCTAEAKSITAALDELAQARISVYGISVDDVESKRGFCAKYGLAHVLLADPDKTVCAAYGTLNQRGLSNRVTFILDEARIIRVIDRKVRVRSHGADLLEIVERLRREDARTALASLNEEPMETGLGTRMHTPKGWKVKITSNGQAVTWRHPEIEGCELSLALLPSEPDTLTIEAMRRNVPDGVEVRTVEEILVGDQRGIRIDGLDRTQDPPRYITGVRWVHEPNDVSLSLAAPADRAADAARLLAAVVGSID